MFQVNASSWRLDDNRRDHRSFVCRNCGLSAAALTNAEQTYHQSDLPLQLHAHTHIIIIIIIIWLTVWRSGNGVSRINDVTLRRARLVMGWVTVSGFDSQRRHFISVCNQPPRSTQPFVLSKSADVCGVSPQERCTEGR